MAAHPQASPNFYSPAIHPQLQVIFHAWTQISQTISHHRRYFNVCKGTPKTKKHNARLSIFYWSTLCKCLCMKNPKQVLVGIQQTVRLLTSILQNGSACNLQKEIWPIVQIWAYALRSDGHYFARSRSQTSFGEVSLSIAFQLIGKLLWWSLIVLCIEHATGIMIVYIWSHMQARVLSHCNSLYRLLAYKVSQMWAILTYQTTKRIKRPFSGIR